MICVFYNCQEEATETCVFGWQGELCAEHYKQYEAALERKDMYQFKSDLEGES